MSRGCGCESGILRYVKPPFSKLFYVACCIHDDDYDRGGSDKDRKTADISLYRNMCKIIERMRCGPWRAFFYTFIALLYYASVRLCGRFYFRFT